MTADPGAGMSFVADPKKPVGGHILAHASATRIMVSRYNLEPPLDIRMLRLYFSWRKAELRIGWPRYMIRQKCRKTKRPFLSEMMASIIANPRPVLRVFRGFWLLTFLEINIKWKANFIFYWFCILAQIHVRYIKYFQIANLSMLSISEYQFNGANIFCWLVPRDPAGWVVIETIWCIRAHLIVCIFI